MKHTLKQHFYTTTPLNASPPQQHRQVGEGHMRGVEATGDVGSGRPCEDLGPRGTEAVPRQVRRKRRGQKRRGGEEKEEEERRK